MLKKLAFLGLFSAISALSANYAAQAAVFNINSLDFGDGFVASGTITTDDTIGSLTSANLTNWDITVTDGVGGSGFNFTETNSGAFIQGLSTDGTQLTVLFPNGVLQFQTPVNPFLSDFVLSLARFDFGRNRAAYINRIDVIDVDIDPLASSSPYIIGELAETTTTPEPGSIFALLGLGLGFVAAKGKKQA
ncbi:PEP-CTERM sorting domain-containing protein [Crocosphaera watsonii WH 8501]|uniref:Ice-binding protein C-terminal domain-containing protein n=5 Tax=Crocosphaera watsonii TaxID=263511 RepID=Q4C2R5_CROWT|nr:MULTISPECIES: PEP-CTERM sorting domain-containing protein [Crocosphaera]EAM50443.1 hypothetical protein CwatDRAFT_3077 [Crocosphaera watsonii WH 8501]EHJ12338.1 hypothetical protein CWATWH0003_2958 [Crocosphaera watsonii WH 0003]NQZ61583.1 PEP-CTERM sorting domain-containing protein [Crocosphaera sp.]CCQ48999.1 hypothetical protein CWATWH8502_1640 [Crocosphaera watsonii WH 8502]CCQ60811.1 hypothetical protein CWATWH0401_2636 [Crocosphaera watsonii WH 0401]